MSTPALTAVTLDPLAPVFTGRTRSGAAFEVFDRIAGIDPLLWQTVFPPSWKDYRYFQTLEETFGGEFPQRYLVLREKEPAAFGVEPAVRAILPLFFVEQDLTVSLAARVRALLRPLRRMLTLRLLMAGCIVGDAQVGIADQECPPAAVFGELDEALELYARRERASIRLFKDLPESYRPALAPLVARGRYTRLPSLPGVSLPLNFGSFDEYLQDRLGKSTRKSLRRKFREIDALAEPITLEVKDSVTPAEAVALHALYERVALRGDVHFEVFTAGYFLKLGERMPETTRYFIWRHAGRIVSFSFCTIHDGAIYDNDIGFDEEAAAALHLYHATFRDIVRCALAHGLKHYHSAPFNYDPKLHLRMDLVPLDLYARHTSPVVNRLLRWFAPLAAPTRQEPLLAQFPNAGRL